jgi:hypothetical protein
MKKARINMKRAKARDDQAMYLHHEARYRLLAA